MRTGLETEELRMSQDAELQDEDGEQAPWTRAT
jgi:hypothetical protein